MVADQSTGEISRLSFLREAILNVGRPEKDVPKKWATDAGGEADVRLAIKRGLDAGRSEIWKVFDHIWREEKAGAELETLVKKAAEKQTRHDMFIALALASLREHKMAIETIEAALDEEQKKQAWKNAILTAIEFEGDRPLEILLESRTRTNPPTIEHLRLACDKQDLRKLKMLLEHGADPNSETFCERAIRAVPILIREMNRNAPTTILSALVEHGAKTLLPDHEVERLADSSSISLRTKEWIRRTDIRGVGKEEPIEPIHWGHCLINHMEFLKPGAKREEKLKEIRAVVENWPQTLLERVARELPDSALRDPDKSVLKLLSEEVVRKKKATIGQTRRQETPTLEL